MHNLYVLLYFGLVFTFIPQVEDTGATACCRIFVGGLPPTVTDQILHAHFEK